MKAWNTNYISKNSINYVPIKNLVDSIKSIDTDGIREILRDCAEQLLIENRISNEELLNDINETGSTKYKVEIHYIKGEDTLGTIYSALRNISDKKETGSYYTPVSIVQNVIESLHIEENKTIIDPCCGTGNWLINLPDRIKATDVYGSDIDELSINLARINIQLRYADLTTDQIKEHIKLSNYFIENDNSTYDYIIGNPPWGADTKKLDTELRKLYRCADTTNIESFSICIEKALTKLNKNGRLAFILPESILNVKVHSMIREVIVEAANIERLEYLGDIFENVQCPCISLILRNTGKRLNTIGTVIKTIDNEYTINIDREMNRECWKLSLTDDEYELIEKLRDDDNDVIYLDGCADFALGIITGDNSSLVSNTQKPGYEPIIKGTDITKYKIAEPTNFIQFKPKKLQQVAPEELYRQEKLVYRFISKDLIFAYDNSGTLTLNSCNIVIPRVLGVKTKYILAVLNSRLANFIYRKEFNSIKVLRQHIESIPIPYVSISEQDEIIDLVDKIIDGTGGEQEYNEIDNKISDMFNLTVGEKQLIRNGDSK